MVITLAIMEIPLEISWSAAAITLLLLCFPSWVFYHKRQKSFLFDLYHMPDLHIFRSFLNWQNAFDLLRAGIGVYLLLYIVFPEKPVLLPAENEAYLWFWGIFLGVICLGVTAQTFVRYEGYFSPNYPFHYQLGGSLILLDPWTALFALALAICLVKAFRHYEWLAPGFIIGAGGYAFLFGGLNLLLLGVFLLQGLPLLLALLGRQHLRLLRFRTA